MKRVFCDCCGREMEHSESDNQAFVHGKHATVSGAEKIWHFEVKIDVSPRTVANGQHYDFCCDCKQRAVAMLFKNLMYTGEPGAGE